MAVFSTSHDLDIDGLNLHAEVAGSGPPIVLVHGFTGTGASWRSLVEALAPDCTTIAVDLVGHGRSGCPEALDRYQMRRAVDDLAVMLHALGVRGNRADELHRQQEIAKAKGALNLFAGLRPLAPRVKA